MRAGGPPAGDPRADELRAAMVEDLLAGGRIHTPAVERAFRRVPRHVFLPDTPLEQAYQDEAVATKWQDGVAISSASQPSMMAIMLEQLGLRPGHRVLEVGAGTGYNAALMADMVGPTGSVVAVDIDDDLIRGAAEHLTSAGAASARLGTEAGRGLGARITLATRDGALGYPEAAPYDRIVLTVGSWDIQPAWWRQLVPGGRLLLPLSVRGSQLSVALDLDDGPPPVLRSVSVRSCAFVRLRGQGAGPDPSTPVADGLAVQTGDDHVVDADRLVRLLALPGADRPTSVRVAAADLWDGLGLWLAVREPDACRLLVNAASERYRSLSLLPAGPDGGTMALVGPAGLAALVARDPHARGRRVPVAVRPYGPDGARLADRLAAAAREWLAAGRPSASRLLLTVHLDDPPHPCPDPPGTVRLRKTHSRLTLAWPGGADAAGPKLGR